jgi:aspartyl-tRNA(Asn)/glutamyl-tRNA(Gln) amidotransferase subunit A
MNTNDLCHLTIARAGELIRAGDLSPIDLTEAFLARIEELNPVLNAYVLVTAERAREDARRAEKQIAAGEYRGPLHGIPIGLKDIYDTAEIPTTASSHLYAERVPDADAETTHRLAEAGAVLLGKLTTHEFAFGGPSWDLPTPPASNPWKRGYFTGGSSSGSGAATAAGLAMGTMGSDTGGSIRMPAFFCGIAGLKPTYGRVSRRGVAPLSYSLDHCGPMTWDATDCALMMNVLAGHDPQDPASARRPSEDFTTRLDAGIAGKRIGLIRQFYDGDAKADATVLAAMEESERTFTELGATVEDVALSPLQDYHACNFVIMLAEAFAVHRDNLTQSPEKYGEVFRDRMSMACLISGLDYVQAIRLRRILKAEVDDALARFDFLVTAGGFMPAPPLEEMPKFFIYQTPLLSSPFNVSGHPAMGVCNGFSEAGLPVGMQIVGRAFDEAGVLGAAAAFERATTFRERRPSLG